MKDEPGLSGATGRVMSVSLRNSAFSAASAFKFQKNHGYTQIKYNLTDIFFMCYQNSFRFRGIVG